MTLLDKIGDLSSTQFENLVYDCVRSIGVRNLVWRTPGMDGGRDIEGQVVVTDIVGVDKLEKWYVECKKYKRSIDWPTVWKKVAYADSQQADVFLLATNTNPSPVCESEISKWNHSRRRPTIRIWRGYSFAELLATRTHITLSHGLAGADVHIDHQVLPFCRLILGVVQAANSSVAFDTDGSIALETASVLTELLEQRLSDLDNHGHFGSGYRFDKPRPAFSNWLCAEGDYSQIEEIAFYSTVMSLLYFSGADSIATVATGHTSEYVLKEPRFGSKVYYRSLTTVLEWSCAELEQLNDDDVRGVIRFRNSR